MPPTPHSLVSRSFPTLLFSPNKLNKPNLSLSPNFPRCSVLSISPEKSLNSVDLRSRPSPAEVSRTIMELCSTGTLSTLTPDGWPLGVGARFVVDAGGEPSLCLNEPGTLVSNDGRSSLHVRLEQSRARTSQCTLLGSLKKPDDEFLVKKLRTKWEKKFGEEMDENLLYVISIERVLQMEDFKEEGMWVTSSEYLNAEPDPLRNFAEDIVEELNTRHSEDVQRICNVYVDFGFQVTNAKLIWVDRLGFDLYVYSENGVFTTRIPFPREVTDEKGVKSSFNCMSHLAWEVEKSYVLPDFEKVRILKKIS